MADIAQIKELRERTGSGMSDCKKALVECAGDMDKSIEYLRTKGLAKAAKKAGRIATEGLVQHYVHMGGRIGVLVEINCETDFVALNSDFITFTKDVAMQVAAMSPQYVSQDEVPVEMVEAERKIRIKTAKESGKPEKILDKIVDGQIAKWMKELCLLDQTFVKDDKKSIFDLQAELISKLGENIKIRRFTRYELGEGLEKKSQNFVEEVAKMTQAN